MKARAGGDLAAQAITSERGKLVNPVSITIYDGSKSVIGAGSVVRKDIPCGVFAAGNPCRVIREISE